MFLLMRRCFTYCLKLTIDIQGKDASLLSSKKIYHSSLVHTTRCCPLHRS